MIESPSTATPHMGEMKVLTMPKADKPESISQLVVILKNGEFVTRFQCQNEVDEWALISRAKLMIDVAYQKKMNQMIGTDSVMIGVA